MQILTKCFIVCAIAAAIAPFSSRGADTDAQMKAREALRQKMSELEAQPVATNPAPAAVAPAKPPKTRPVPAPAVTKPAESVKTIPEPAPAPVRPAETTPAPAPAPAPVVKTTQPPKSNSVAKTHQNSGPATASRPDSERIAKAREALEMKMKELNAQPEVAAQPPSQPATTSTSAPASRTPEVTSTSQPSTSTDTSEALPAPPPRKKSQEAETKQAQQSKKPRETRPAPESRPMYALPKGPPPPVSEDKVQKLNALLQRYEADQVTPEQYHAERAKILAGQ